MNKKKNLIFFLLFILLINCSFDDKTGIWGGGIKEKRRISELEKAQKEIISVEKIYTSEDIYSKDIELKKTIDLSKALKNSSWKMSNLNYENFLGNIYLSGINNVFLKKKIGKNKFSLSRIMSSPLIYEDNMIFSDDSGTIFNTNLDGKIKWKKNIYKKIFKKIYKNLNFSIYKNNIYVVDNIGFIYSIALDSGKLIWIKNHGIPLKSNVKIYKNKIFLFNQDNRLLCFNTKDGSIIWNIRSVTSFIKVPNFLSLALSKEGNVIALNSSGDLFKVNGTTGEVYWTLNTARSLYAHATDFFKSSSVVIANNDIIFSAGTSIFSYKLNNGYLNWENEVNIIGTPIISGKYIFSFSDNGYFIIINKDTGEIVSSKNVLKILKKKKRETKISGYILGSGKVYSVTENGYLIVSSALSGKAEYFKKIGDPINSTPIINNGKLYILTANSRIIGFN